MDARIALRRTLDEELATLLRRHGKIDAHLKNEDREVPADAPDRATFLENDQVLEALDERTRLRIRELRRAIARMDEPQWGVCGGCLEAIGAARMAALPTATRCMNCAAALASS